MDIGDMKYVLNMDGNTLLCWLIENFEAELPASIDTVEEMQAASGLLLKLANQYSYLCSLLSYAKLCTREAKRNSSKTDKESVRRYEDFVDKREIIQNMVEATKQRYSAVSRAVTIHVENNQELKMNTSGSIYSPRR